MIWLWLVRTHCSDWSVFEATGFRAPLFTAQKHGEVCSGPDELLGRDKSVGQCSDLCAAELGCKYFAVTGRAAVGKCYWQKSDCKTFMSTDADLYSLEADAQILKVGAECDGADELLTKENTGGAAGCKVACEVCLPVSVSSCAAQSLAVRLRL